MSIVYLWLPRESAAPGEKVLLDMERALRVSPEQFASSWAVDGFGIGVLEAPVGRGAPTAPVRGGDRWSLWIFGEIYDGGTLVDAAGMDACRRPEVGQRLLKTLIEEGFARLGTLDGEYVLVLWDALRRRLLLANDRFGGLPLYWSRSSRGIAIAGGVRGVLAAPGMSAEPDEEALREAVTFGGFRLGGRTNVRGVEMLPGATVATVRGHELDLRRYWRYTDVPHEPSAPTEELLERARFLWKRAMRIRTDDCGRPGQTLSGGLDSRAILAEAAPKASSWAAVTYGVPGCDDARFAERAARAAGARWHYLDLYPPGRDWLAERSRHIQDTDGLVALGDLMHVDTVSFQKEVMDVHVSGYIGDAVCGPTFAEVDSAAGLYATLPYYSTEVGLDGESAHQRILNVMDALEGAPPRFALFEHKLPQATNRWTAAWRPWIAVRKPFVDHQLFDFWQGLPVAVRTTGNLYERFLLETYPTLFARIPNQKTGVPVLTPPWRYHIGRVARFAMRRLRRRLGLNVPARAYHDDRAHLDASARNRLETVLTSRGSLCGAILGHDRIRRVLEAWLERDAAPEQVIGALYVFETYHSGLGQHLQKAVHRP